MKDPWKDFKVEKCMGLKQMHPMQVESLMDFIGLSLMAAAETCLLYTSPSPRDS